MTYLNQANVKGKYNFVIDYYRGGQNIVRGVNISWGSKYRLTPALTLRPWDHTTQPRIGRPKMKLRTTDPQMSRSGPTQSRTLQIKISAVSVFLEANHHSIITHIITLDKKTLK